MFEELEYSSRSSICIVQGSIITRLSQERLKKVPRPRCKCEYKIAFKTFRSNFGNNDVLGGVGAKWVIFLPRNPKPDIWE